MKCRSLKIQLEKIKVLADHQKTLTPLETIVLNFCERLIDTNDKQSDEIQALKNKINALQGEQGTPNVRKQSPNKNNDHSSEDNRKTGKKRKPRSKRGSNKSKAKTDQRVRIEMKREHLPPDAVRNGIKETLIQDINITTNNTLFMRQKYYSSSENKYYLTPLPAGYEGEYGPSIKSWSSVLYSANEMTTENITSMFNTPVC